MREIIQQIAGESKKSRHTALFSENSEITNLKKNSGLYEEFGREKIYINEAKDIEKFYYALIEALDKDQEAKNTVREVFNRTVY